MLGDVAGYKAWCVLHDIEIPEGTADAAIEAALGRATGVLASILRRRVEAVEDTSVTIHGNQYMLLPLPDFISISGVDENGVEMDASTYDIHEGFLDRLDGGVWARGSRYTVRGDLGYVNPEAVPDDILDAVYVLTSSDMAGGMAGDVKSVSIQGISVSVQSAADQKSSIEVALARHIKVM